MFACFWRGYHQPIRVGYGSGTTDVLWGPWYCQFCGVPLGRTM